MRRPRQACCQITVKAKGIFQCLKHNPVLENPIFTWAYIAKVPAKMRRKTSRFNCLTAAFTTSDWVGHRAWSSPIVPVAPPYIFSKKLN